MGKGLLEFDRGVWWGYDGNLLLKELKINLKERFRYQGEGGGEGGSGSIFLRGWSQR